MTFSVTRLMLSLVFIGFISTSSVPPFAIAADKNAIIVPAAANGDWYRILQLLKQGVDINARDKDGRTALMLASDNGHPDIVNLLVQNGADVNLKDNNNQTAIMLASKNGHIDAVEILMNAGANIDAQDQVGKTALSLARENGHAEIVDLLATRRLSPMAKSSKYKVISVFYGTDRNVTGASELTKHYGSDRGTLELGVCQISIPKDHRIGELETPFIALRVMGLAQLFQDPEKHVALLSIESLREKGFLDELKDRLKKSSREDAFIFIHGYNVSFEDSCRRAGQLAHDLKFPGAPLMYSWPSDSEFEDYLQDETDIDWSTQNFERFVQTVTQSGVRNLYLIAHSMGGRAVVGAVARIVSRKRDLSAPIFRQIILAAPDIDAGVFRNLEADFKKATLGITLYASGTDIALNGSRRAHGFPRLGEAGSNLYIASGIDTVDVSAIDASFTGHSYYGDNSSVIADLFELIVFGRPPQERFGLQERQRHGLKYWEFLARR